MLNSLNLLLFISKIVKNRKVDSELVEFSEAGLKKYYKTNFNSDPPSGLWEDINEYCSKGTTRRDQSNPNLSFERYSFF